MTWHIFLCPLLNDLFVFLRKLIVIYSLTTVNLHHQRTKDSSSRFQETDLTLHPSLPVIHFICTPTSSRLLTTLTAVASTVPLLL